MLIMSSGRKIVLLLDYHDGISVSLWENLPVRGHAGTFQHDRANYPVGLRPGLVVGHRPTVSQNVAEGIQQDRSDDGIVLWPDTIGDVPLAQALEGACQHLWLPEVLDDQGQRSQQFLALLFHVGRFKEGSRLGKAGKEPFIEGGDKRFSLWGNC